MPESFFSRFYYETNVYRLWIIAPWFTPLETQRVSLVDILRKVSKENIETTVITRWPDFRHHVAALKLASKVDNLEIILNNNLHAKLYIYEGRERSLALLCSANLTTKGAEGIEVGLLVRRLKWGAQLIRELVGTARYIRNADGRKRVKELGRSMTDDEFDKTILNL